MIRGNKKVVIFANTCWNLVNYRANLIAGFMAAGYEVHAVAPRDEYRKKLTALGAKHYHIHLSAHSVNLLTEMKTFTQILLLLEKIKPDLVLTFTIKPNIYGGIATRIFGIPLMANITGLGLVFLKTNDLRWRWKMLYRFSLTSAYKVFFQNPDDLKLFSNLGLVSTEQARLLPGSGIDCSKIKVSPLSNRHGIKFLFIGRLLKEKGIFEYLEAATAVKGNATNANFCAVGHLPSKRKERDRVIRHLENSPVEYRGPVCDSFKQIEDADVIVLPSYREGTPRVVLEAGAIGRPVIAADVPGCSWAILDQVTGFLVAPRSASSLAETMGRLASIPRKELEVIGMAGRKYIEEHFADHAVITEYLSAATSL